MARTELPNGVILPAEYSDDWYDVMTSNLSKLDEVIGSDADKLSAEDVGAAALSNDYTDLDNKPALKPVATSGDYDDLDNKPDLNPYDQHLANTDIHVTTADKTKWNNGVTQAYVLRYASTSVTPSSTISYSVLNNTDNIKAGDSVIDSAGQVFLIASVDSVNQTVTVSAVLLTLALDANVMHLSVNETVAGIKTFSDIPIFATFAGIRFRCADNSGAYVTFRNANQANPGSIIFSANDGNVGTAFHLVDKTLIPYTNGDIDLGTSLRKWKSFNGINPGALSLPDLNNGIDISGYLTTGDSDNSYTPLVDGYISVRVNGTTSSALYALQGDVNTSSYGNIVDIDLGGFTCSFFIPVIKNVACRIVCRRVQTIVSAKFFPCLGNV